MMICAYLLLCPYKIFFTFLYRWNTLLLVLYHQVTLLSTLRKPLKLVPSNSLRLSCKFSKLILSVFTPSVLLPDHVLFCVLQVHFPKSMLFLSYLFSIFTFQVAPSYLHTEALKSQTNGFLTFFS